MNEKRRSPLRIVLIILACIVALVLIVIAGINIYVRVAFGSFYDHSEKAFDQPGINEGFIPQDLDHVEAADLWLFSGYVSGDGPSPLYRRDNLGRVSTIYLLNPDGSTYTGHGSAVTSDDGFVFVACEGGYLAFNLNDIVEAPDQGSVQSLQKVDLDFSPAFMNIENGTLYTGVFYYPNDYETPDSYHLTTPDGTENPAIMYAYPTDPIGLFGYASTPSRVYSIPGMIQGVAEQDGQIVLSQSYGLAASHLMGYDLDAIDAQTPDTFIADEQVVPLYYLEPSVQTQDLVGPPMSEGIENHDGKLFVSFESASNKYIFGKLYGGGAVFAVEGTH